jgi:hypothetical protein
MPNLTFGGIRWIAFLTICRSRSSSLFCSSFSISISISVGSICGILSESAIPFAPLAFFGARMLGRLFIIAARLCHYPLSNTFAAGIPPNEHHLSRARRMILGEMMSIEKHFLRDAKWL